ncbi:MFS transporter, partial [Coxiella endosymbiont of Ornithodoros amblus]|nr:MFS transporter [Coxiella endosymbiont of Ornithodoros amblus]
RMLENAPIYSTYAYQVALTMIPLLFLLALFIGKFGIKETFAKKQY